MPMTDHVSVVISQSSANVTRQGFGTGMFLSYYANWVERQRSYSSLLEVAADFTDPYSPEYLAAQSYFGQTPSPSKLVIGRGANKPTKIFQLSAINPVSNLNYTYRLKVRGKAFGETTVTYTSDGTPTDAEWAAGMVAALNAVVGKNYTASGAASPITITGNAAGDWFSVEVLDINYQKITETHVDPGVAADLTAIQTENSDWYCLLTGYNSKLYSIAAAAWVESNGKIYVADTNDTNSLITAVGNGDLMDQIKTNAYAATLCTYHPSPAVFMAAALVGRCLPLTPGGETWKFKTLAGVPAYSLTSTQKSNIVARNGNGYETISSLNITFDGKTGDGNFLDVRRGLDYLREDLTKSVFTALAANDKVPYTDAGISIIESEVRGALKRSEVNGILDFGSEVIVPLVSSVSAADKTSRTLNNVKFKGKLAGAIHKANVVGTVIA